MHIIRPGSPTANARIREQEKKSGYPLILRDCWWVQRVTYEHFTDADTSQVLTLNTLFPENPFPPDVFLLDVAYFDLREVFAAPTLTDLDFILGITGNTNGLIEVTAVETAQDLGVKAPGGDLYAAATRYQAAMSPLLQADSTADNLADMTSGVVDIYIPYSYRPTSRPA
jgi:hypothetical protein